MLLRQLQNIPRNNLYWLFGPPFLFVALAIFLFPLNTQFQFNHDEGVELMKALLVHQGFSLYAEIWNDQAPVLTHIFAQVFPIAGYRVTAYRLIVLIFSASLLISASYLLQQIGGRRLGVLGVVLIAFLPSYMVLSVSAMIGLPSLALAVFSLLGLCLWHTKRHKIWLLLSAISLSFSVAIKIFTSFLAPIFLAGLIVEEIYRKQSRLHILLPAFAWGIVFLGSTGVWVYTLVGIENLFQMLFPMIGGNEVTVEGQTLLSHIKNQVPLFTLAIIGTFVAYKKRVWFMLYPLVWMCAAGFLLSLHRPVWDHLTLLVTIPAAMLASWAVQGVFEKLPDKKELMPWIRSHSMLWLIGLTALILHVFDFHVPKGFELVRQPGNEMPLVMEETEARILSDISNYAPKTDWMVTDNLMMAFLTRSQSPPNLAVFSIKRYESGVLTDEEIIQVIQDYDPGIVLLSRLQYPLVEIFLQSNFTLVREEGFGPVIQRLYVNNSIVP